MKLDVDAAFPGTSRTVGDVLLQPTRIYVKAVLPVREHVHAMAHITGGGLTGNVPRVLPAGCRAIVRRRAWDVPPEFQALQAGGGIDDAEMFRTFNMGLGYVVIVPADRADRVANALRAAGERVQALGEIVAGEPGVEIVA
jgi:phosphoribosylformylglycinamidine cyclo-ligase